MALEPDFSKGLLPAILQDETTKQVLMLGYMNEAAFLKTVEDGVVWFYSRSKSRLWKKGETSGHIQVVTDMTLDCDQDALLVFVRPEGPTCHTGSTSCFNTEVTFAVQHLAQTIEQSLEENRESSYTNYLIKEGIEKITKKFGEEAFEVVIASMKNDRSEIIDETADLMYHLFVLLKERGIPFDEVEAVLERRHHKKSNFKGERKDIRNW
ncbi:bifunctional phosphoribosyl-AMP cyclohydrolase/phosphoribosyl-ATP diphosphatase HisIE [Staphylococcus massiliensis]|uniref:Histidine biosynthesis bifunctional protein HisIE n=1 Tax=Staphylococcus massiliensis S46 TaxID=1229783 RepID=K9B9U8_9STAP|nr:bifunctional phosphoribosyl-AMP cyclohydrolase/phosphoribosyl-ATP diphosphatase HisIE [Staphylococcus massiliensis]EKU50530.1 bifunctional phosphoribosyl-AMP cyclohydrolase/phosphoribosyl-ATP pyrophosphatase protein [Staphylococcus massiliensis S46]MCG3398699.1 bifunctional phosphoribosyl-AMP cyclohydrolase/phosphoribosyl-ATP diphosphatase HisIE [Staphylococcus massiliensis]POA00400.1 bifunctional phosphoribosyl-AMP cyclohydrolase/phosphoribosyl-ATP diphosphatase HisIE [Staphylococcus massili